MSGYNSINDIDSNFRNNVYYLSVGDNSQYLPANNGTNNYYLQSTQSLPESWYRRELQLDNSSISLGDMLAGTSQALQSINFRWGVQNLPAMVAANVPQLTALTEINITQEAIPGAVLSHLLTLAPHLQCLRIGVNSYPYVSPLSEQTEGYIHNLLGPFPLPQNLPELSELDVYWGMMSRDVLGQLLGIAPNLQRLTIFGIGMSSKISNIPVQQMHNLHSLNLRAFQIDQPLNNLCNNTMLEELHLERCFSVTGDPEWCNAQTQLPHLRLLNLAASNVPPASFVAFLRQTARTLQTLYIDQTGISGDGAAVNLAGINFPELRELAVAGCGITVDVLKTILENAPNLRKLDIAEPRALRDIFRITAELHEADPTIDKAKVMMACENLEAMIRTAPMFSDNNGRWLEFDILLECQKALHRHGHKFAVEIAEVMINKFMHQMSVESINLIASLNVDNAKKAELLSVIAQQNPNLIVAACVGAAGANLRTFLLAGVVGRPNFTTKSLGPENSMPGMLQEPLRHVASYEAFDIDTIKARLQDMLKPRRLSMRPGT